MLFRAITASAIAAASPLAHLDARQAITVASIAYAVGLIAVAVFFAYYIHTLWSL